jgi:hypothetical protein
MDAKPGSIKPFSEWSLLELETSKHLFESMAAEVAKHTGETPAPVWEPVLEIIARNRAELQAEIERRAQL